MNVIFTNPQEKEIQMNTIRYLFIGMLLFSMTLMNTGCTSFIAGGLQTSDGYKPLFDGGMKAQLPRFGNYDENGNMTLQSSAVRYYEMNEITVVNSTEHFIDVLEGDVVRKRGVGPSNNASLVAFVPYRGNEVDLPVTVNIYRFDGEGKKVMIGQKHKVFHFYGGRRERLQWVIGTKYDSRIDERTNR